MLENNDGNENCLKEISETQRKTNWLPWLLVAGMGVLLILNYVGTPVNTSSKLLSGQLVLICPLLMLFMMFGHGHNHNSSSNSNQEPETGQDGQSGCCHSHEAHKYENK